MFPTGGNVSAGSRDGLLGADAQRGHAGRETGARRHGGDAVHEFSRYSYGWYQSLGCVELPWASAEKAYPYLTYGSLVTVTGPVA